MRFFLSLSSVVVLLGVKGVLSSVVWEREWTLLLLLWSFDDDTLSLEKKKKKKKKKSSFVEEFWQEKENGGDKKEKKKRFLLLQEEGNLSLSREGALWPIKLSCFSLFFSVDPARASSSSSSREKESTHNNNNNNNNNNKARRRKQKIERGVKEALLPSWRISLSGSSPSKERERERENQQGFLKDGGPDLLCFVWVLFRTTLRALTFNS